MAWAGFMDVLEERLSLRKFRKLRTVRPSWRLGSIEELRDYQTDYAIIEACRDLGFCGKTEMKALHGLLNKRNECAHPSDYFPGLNDTLGYISEVFKRVGTLRAKGK